MRVRGNPMVRRLRAILVALLVAAAGGLVWWLGRQARRPAALAAGPSAAWVVSDGVRLPADAPPGGPNEVWDGQTIRLQALRNEVVAWQVAVRPGRPVVGLNVTLGPLAGEGGALLRPTAIQRFREHFLTVTAASQWDAEHKVPHGLGPGRYPCQLIPLAEGATLEAPAGEATVIWFDLTVPRDAAPGVYRGRLTIDGGDLAVNWPLEVTVLSPRLPAETHFRNFFYYGPEQLAEFYQAKDRSLAAIEDAYLRFAHDHRVTLATEPLVADGRFDWGRWEAAYGRYLDGSAYTTGPCAGAPATMWPVTLSREASEADFKAACRSIVNHFEARGLLDKIVYVAWDEPNDAAAYREIRRLGRWVDEAVGQRLPVMVTEQLSPTEPGWGSLVGAVDIFCSADSGDAEMAAHQQRGGQVWVYNGGLAGGPYIDQPLLGMVAWGPAAWRWRLGGWYMWDSLYWRQKHYGLQTMTDLYADPLTFDETKRVRDGKPYPAEWALRLNGDGVFLYPGEPVGVAGPVGCLRLKAFRRGAQDYEYLWLLRQAGHGRRADEFARRLSTGRGAWETNPDVWITTRREMAALLTGAG